MNELEAGRELDALVAEKVMGWDGCHDIHYCEDTWYNYCRNPGCYKTGSEDEIMMWEPGDPPIQGCEGYPPYSTNIAAAWQVVEKMEEKRNKVIQLRWTYLYDEYVWECAISQAEPAIADTAPLAICRAALKAIGAIE